MSVLKYQVSNLRSIELERPQTECGNTRRGLTLNQGLVDWRATVNGTRICSAEACTVVARSRGLCHNHYQQWLYKNRRTAQSRKYRASRPTQLERFNAKFVRGADSQCWEWMGARGRLGYGIFGVRGTSVGAHRVALEMATGEPAPEGMLACHRCDNPPCVNPKHLYWGTHQSNSDDAVARSRIPLGEAKAQAILTESQVVDIRERYRNGEKQGAIASDLGVSSQTVRSIALGLKWKHAPGPISEPRRRK